MQVGVVKGNQPYGLPLSDPTIADRLQDAGYETSMFGKWHIGHHNWASTPNYRGFDTFYGESHFHTNIK